MGVHGEADIRGVRAHFDGKSDLEFTVQVDLMPDFELTDVSKLKVERLVGEASRNSLSAVPATDVTPDILCWSHIYLGRIHDVLDERDQAVTEYRAAMNVAGAPEAARQAAKRGLVAGFQSPPPGPKN